jgi:CubicO group peptidase (beta-lactamase class C family)
MKFLPALLVLCLPTPARADALTDKVDKLFARWDKPGTPGCSLGVVRDGRLVYEKSYGQADVEQDRRIGPDTVFHIASISKQFTAFAVLLLEKDGKLSLDDDVRKYLPELHDFGKRITLRHLLLHTSGLRDQWDLLVLAGWRMSDVITEDDVFRLVCRQRELNFDPGARHLYCNTGYTLAARVVERVSGQPFREFARRRIFEPLGMKHTRFPADHEEIVPGRARSYNPSGPGTYRNAILSYGTAGATSLLTTVSDLARWDQNFYEPRVGDEKLIARLQEAGALNDGKKIDYALGVEHGEYRGLKCVEHGGSDAGFRCDLIRFPAERFSVIILANTSDVNAGNLARQVTGLYLADKLTPEPKQQAVVERKEVPVDPAALDALVGEYRVGPGVSITVAKEDGKLTAIATGLTGARKVVLLGASDREFFVQGEAIGIAFDTPVDGKCPSITADLFGHRLPGKRVERPTLTAKKAVEYVGDYYSSELGVIYTIVRRDVRLVIRRSRAESELKPLSADVFEGPGPAGQFTFTRAPGGEVTGVKLDGGRVQKVRFERVDLKPSR